MSYRHRLLARAASTLGGLLLLAACTGGDGADGRAVATTITVPVVATTNPSETTTTGTGTTTPSGQITSLVLDPRGFNVAVFGDAPATVVASLTLHLGNAQEDSGWRPRGEVFGVCPGTRTRLVRWGHLSTLYSDGPTSYAPAGRQHFFAYEARTSRVGGVRLATAAGVAVGSSVADLRRAYGSAVQVREDRPPVGPTFRVGRSGRLGWLYGSLTAAGAGGRVTSIGAGDPCGG